MAKQKKVATNARILVAEKRAIRELVANKKKVATNNAFGVTTCDAIALRCTNTSCRKRAIRELVANKKKSPRITPLASRGARIPVAEKRVIRNV